MGIFSTFRSSKPPSNPNRTWDKHFYTRLVDDTDTETADLIWESFRNALSESMREWRAAVAAKDFAKIKQIAHKTRSSSLLLGFREFATLSQKIEMSLADDPANPAIDGDLEQWSKQAAEAIEILDQQPATLLGQQPVAFAENGVDSN